MKRVGWIVFILCLLLAGCQTDYESIDWGNPVSTVDFDLEGMTENKDAQNHIEFYINMETMGLITLRFKLGMYLSHQQA